METKFLTTLAFLVVTAICVGQNSPSLVGTWKLVSGKMQIGDSATVDLSTMESMKIVTPTHFAVFTKNTSTGDLAHAAAGSVSVDANRYTETITYATGKGNKYPIIAKFSFELNGDQWRIKGGYDNYFFDETWQRVK